MSKEEFDFHLENVLAPRMSQLPDNVKILAIDIRKSYEELIKSKKTEIEGLLNNEKNERSVRKVVAPKLKDDDDYDDNEFEKEDIENNKENNNKNNNKNEKNIKNNNENHDENDDTVNMRLSTMKLTDFLDTDDIFSWNEERAIKRVLELKDENEMKKQKDFLEWKIKKDLESREREEKEVHRHLYYISISMRTYCSIFLLCFQFFLNLLHIFLSFFYPSVTRSILSSHSHYFTHLHLSFPISSSKIFSGMR